MINHKNLFIFKKLNKIMGFFDKIRKIFKKTEKSEAIQSDSKRFNTDSKRFKALESASNFAIHEEKHDDKDTDYYVNEGSQEFTELSPLPVEKPKLSDPVELQKESLQLGVAAGYTGKAIREIESSLNRIERGMVSRDWFLSNFSDQSRIRELLSEIKNIIEKHESNASKRFESIEIALNRMALAARGAPEPLRQEIVAGIESIRASLPLSPKMRQLVDVAKKSGRISYEELAARLYISRSALRGLLSNTMKRTAEIERFSVGNKGWVRYKHPKTTQIDTF